MSVAPVPRTDIRFRILVPVWGERYIDNFCAVALPALLSEGNLPTLIDHAECEVIFLTTGWSQPHFESRAGIQALGRVCRYSFVLIDDLFVLDQHSFILTIAYGRGIRSMGDRQTSTYFLFLNADFVFSDGLLRTVVDRVERGFSAVMAPSLRCNEEDVAPVLLRQVSQENGRLSAKPADLVRMTLDNLHPTAAASVMNRAELQVTLGDLHSPAAARTVQHIPMHHAAANQFFWRVDDETLIGRYFLMFMLCIRPEIPYVEPTGWCDYVFIPDMVPSDRYDVLTDSEDGFILELQARQGEFEHMRMGRQTPEEFAPRLSIWTTRGHRDYASRTVIFHAGDPPPGVEAAKAEADAFMARLFATLNPAVSHLSHAFWTGSVAGMRDRLPAVECVELGWTRPAPLVEAVPAPAPIAEPQPMMAAGMGARAVSGDPGLLRRGRRWIDRAVGGLRR